MTPAQQEAARRAEVMLAFSRGETIERRDFGSNDCWLLCGEPCWEWASSDYRVKCTPIEVKLRFAYVAGILTTDCVGFINSDEVYRRLSAADRDLILTFREVI